MTFSAEDLGIRPQNDLFGGFDENDSKADTLELPIRELHGFKDHPFQVKLSELGPLRESIEENGVLSPIIVRKDPNKDGYEIISGHRRMSAATMAGLQTIPAVVLDCTDDEAAVFMVDSNIYREKLLPSEKAFAYKMKAEAMKHQGKKGDWTAQKLAEDAPDSARTIHRYISLTRLIPEILRMVDDDEIGVSIGAELSFLNQEEQDNLHLHMEMYKHKVSLDQATKLHQASKEQTLTDDFLDILFGVKSDPNQTPVQAKPKGVSFNRKQLKPWFDDDMSDSEIMDIIVELLNERYGHGSDENDD